MKTLGYFLLWVGIGMFLACTVFLGLGVVNFATLALIILSLFLILIGNSLS
jgi:hypothetical protein